MANCIQCNVVLPRDEETQFCSTECDVAHEREYEDMCEQEREQLLANSFDEDEKCPCCDELYSDEDSQLYGVCNECVVALAEREKMHALLPIFRPNRADCTCIPF